MGVEEGGVPAGAAAELEDAAALREMAEEESESMRGKVAEGREEDHRHQTESLLADPQGRRGTGWAAGKRGSHAKARGYEGEKKGFLKKRRLHH